VPNPDAILKPGMYATISFRQGKKAQSVLAPSEAVIRTGTRDVVIVALGEGRFRAAQVELGFESGGQSEIRKGLQAGDKVVLSGQFLIDSEASLSATVARLEGTLEAHKGRGTVADVDAATGRVELEHEPIPSLQWSGMKMGFVVENRAQLAAIKKGDAVEFELRPRPEPDGSYVISRIGRKP
jgi:Cu(I)/Ag(I) efflux system membrane fusion protein